MEDESKLIRQFESQFTKQWVKVLEAESDRGTVLVSIAMLDKIIENRLISILSKGNSKAKDRLLRPPLGALSGFSSKVDFLYCSGLLPETMYRDIQLLNKLRNKCAHGWEHFEMTVEVFEKYVKPMFMARGLVAADEQLKKNEDLEGLQILEGKDASEQFKMVMAGLISSFSIITSFVTLECVDGKTGAIQAQTKPSNFGGPNPLA